MVQSLAQDRSRLADYLSDAPDNSPAEAGAGPANVSSLQNAATSKSLSRIDASEQELAPALADSYNNLGAIAASGEDFASALTYFQRAAEWNPSLEGLDHNWGHAAFSASRFQDAVLPLSRALRAHPEDASLRSMLGISQYMTGDYSGALKTLQPQEAQLTAVPQLAFVYAASMVKAGNLQDGLDRLVALEKAYPEIPDIHHELAAAYQQASRPEDAAREKRQYETLLAAKSGAHTR
jgi:Flp pilus assembly protein TadD